MTETVNSDQGLEDVISLIRQSYAEFKYIDVDIKIKGKARSYKQNAALHKYCDEMAFKLNVAGVEYVSWGQYKQSKGIETPWTMELFKGVFKDYAGAMYPEIIDKNGEPKVACPYHKKNFSLEDGKCLDDDYCINTYPVKVEDGYVYIAV